MSYLVDQLTSERLLFRKAQISDFDAWLPFFQTPITSQYWIMQPSDPVISCQNWYDKQFYRYENDQGGLCALIDKKSQDLVGHCGLIMQQINNRTEIEIGYHLLPQFWHKGYAIEAARSCKNFAFENQLCKSLISIISQSNTPSQKVAINNGMSIYSQTQYDNNAVDIFRVTYDQWAHSTRSIISHHKN